MRFMEIAMAIRRFWPSGWWLGLIQIGFGLLKSGIIGESFPMLSCMECLPLSESSSSANKPIRCWG